MGAGSRLRPGPTLRQHQKTFDRSGLLCHPPHILGLTMAQTTLNCIPYPHPRPQGLPAACPPALWVGVDKILREAGERCKVSAKYHNCIG